MCTPPVGDTAHRSIRQEGCKVFGFHRKPQALTYDAKLLKPVIRCSICTGEQTAGFLDRSTGRFEDVMLIRDGKDLQAFRERYGIDCEIEKIY